MSERATRDSEIAGRARQWLLSTTNATLCTRCSDEEMPDWPFGSLAPFALDRDRCADRADLRDRRAHAQPAQGPARVAVRAGPAGRGRPAGELAADVMGRARRVRARSTLRAEHGARTRSCSRTTRSARCTRATARACPTRRATSMRTASATGRSSRCACARSAASARSTGSRATRSCAIRVGGGIADASAPDRRAHERRPRDGAPRHVRGREPRAGAPEGAKIVALDRAGCLVETRAPDGAALSRLRPGDPRRGRAHGVRRADAPRAGRARRAARSKIRAGRRGRGALRHARASCSGAPTRCASSTAARSTRCA